MQPTAPALSELSVVILSYGPRLHLLSQVVERVLGEGVGHVVIVFNGNFADGIWTADSRITLVPLAENLGSAAGYAVGMERARQGERRLMLLLDDDNLPDAGCIARLLATHELLGGGDALCLQAYRPQLEWHRLLLSTGIEALARPNTFAWFHVANERYLLGKQLGGKTAAAGMRFPLARTRVACYGGLLLPSAALDRVAPPYARYFCYYDDIEFTSRISAAGIPIYLCAYAAISDIESSWHIDAERHHPAFSARTPEGRIYLDLRNGTHFNHGRVNHRGVYLFNALLFFLGALVLAMFRSSGFRLSLSRLHLICRAVRAGLTNRLGPNDPA